MKFRAPVYRIYYPLFRPPGTNAIPMVGDTTSIRGAVCLQIPSMNNFQESYDQGSGQGQEAMDRVCELEQELVGEKSRPVLAALLMTVLIFVVLMLGILAYRIVGNGSATAVRAPVVDRSNSTAALHVRLGNARWQACIGMPATDDERLMPERVG